MSLLVLVLRNISGNLFRSGAIFLCASLVAGLGLSATFVVRGAETGLRQNLSRMGADIIAVPWGTMSQDFDGAHLMGMMTERWMPRAYMEKIAAVPGVEATSPQLYVSTWADSGFTTRPELYVVAYEPATDFVLRPWLENDPIGTLRLGEGVAGAAIQAPDGGQRIHLYGYPIHLLRSLEEVGGDIDQTVFISFETALAILEHVQMEAQPAFEINPHTISTAMVKVRLGHSPHDVAVSILEQVPGVLPIESTGFFQTQRSQMVGLLRTVLALSGLTWMLSLAFMGFAFTLAANERRRQIGVLRALGATRGLVLKTLLLEGVVLALSGGAAGTISAVLSAFLFREQIARATDIQYTLPPPLALLGMVAAGLVLALLSVSAAAWFPASRLCREEMVVTVRE